MKFVCGIRHGQDVPPELANSLRDVIPVVGTTCSAIGEQQRFASFSYTYVRRWFRINDRAIQFFGDAGSTEQDIQAAAAKMFIPAPDPVAAPVARLPWPLGINPDMDRHAEQQGLSHWSCTTSTTNQHWIRRDGRVHVVTFMVNGGYPQELRHLDNTCPMSKCVFGVQP